MDCVICQLAFEPEEINGVRELKTLKGYTVDLRLHEFRKVSYGELPEFISFDSPKGQELLLLMHECAIELANARVKQMQRGK